jgi:hypothetical protein
MSCVVRQRALLASANLMSGQRLNIRWIYPTTVPTSFIARFRSTEERALGTIII